MCLAGTGVRRGEVYMGRPQSLLMLTCKLPLVWGEGPKKHHRASSAAKPDVVALRL